MKKFLFVLCSLLFINTSNCYSAKIIYNCEYDNTDYTTSVNELGPTTYKREAKIYAKILVDTKKQTDVFDSYPLSTLFNKNGSILMAGWPVYTGDDNVQISFIMYPVGKSVGGLLYRSEKVINIAMDNGMTTGISYGMCVATVSQ